MLSTSLVVVALAVVLALVALGGGAYEFLVVDPSWPRRPDIIQPERGGISRRRFWIPAHGAFELCLFVALAVTWGAASVRGPLLVALASHAVMRVWSFVDFIPKAAAFERAEPASIEANTSCPKFVPGSPCPRCAGEGRVDPGPMGLSAFGTSSTFGETRRGLRVSPTSAAQRWVRRSIGRLPLDLVTCGALLLALVSVARLG